MTKPLRFLTLILLSIFVFINIAEAVPYGMKTRKNYWEYLKMKEKKNE